MGVHERTQKIVLVDNSTNDETKKLLDENYIPYIYRKGYSHGEGVNEALKLCKTKYALLVDTDVLFKTDHSDIFEQFKKMDLTLMGKIEGDRGGKKIYKRVNPWHCFINVENIKKHNITFFDKKRMEDSFKTEKIYDIGSTFLEDVKKAGLKIGDVDLSEKYYYHFEGMSWYKNKYDPNQGDTGIDFGGTHNVQGYVQAYDYKYEIFNKAKKMFDLVFIKNKYIYNDPILLVKFPTRNRPEKFFKALDIYYSLLSGKQNVRFLITCDTDDITMNTPEVIERLKQYNNLEIIFGNNKTKIEAINYGLDNQKFNIILLASDDMIPVVQGYDDIIVNSMYEHIPDFDGILWFNDGVQGKNLNTLCILGNHYYNRFNYIYNPEYKSLWCDAEFTAVGNILGKQKYINQVIIRHEHHSVIGSGNDELYIRNEKYESEDKQTYIRRQQNNFA
jgi:hypothetical protein